MELPATFVKGFHDEACVRKMEYRRLGKTNLMVSKLSIGGGALSPFYGDVAEEVGIRAVQNAIRSGVNYIDTAPYYGQGKSEKIIGKALKGIPREAYYISTKVGRYEMDIAKQFDFSPKKTRESFQKSLEYLGLDYVDIIQIHDVEFADDLDYLVKETLETIKEFVRDGKVRFIGVTGYPVESLKQMILRAPESISVILAYARHTLLDDTLSKYLPFFQEHDLGVICASGVAMGLLTNNGPQPWHLADPSVIALCKKAADYCKSNGVELSRLALYHNFQLEGAATFLVGMQTDALVTANLESCYGGLTAKELEVLQYLQENVFTFASNWEGKEVAIHREFHKNAKLVN